MKISVKFHTSPCFTHPKKRLESGNVKSTCLDCSSLDRLPSSDISPTRKRAMMIADLRKNWVSSTKMDKVYK